MGGRLRIVLTTLCALLGAMAQEACEDNPLPATAPCTANHDIVVTFDRSFKATADVTASNMLLNEIVNAYDLNPSASNFGPRIGLLSFGEEATIEANLTSDANLLRSTISSARDYTQQTCTTCGVEAAWRHLGEHARQSARKVIILIVDGVDTLRTDIAAIDEAMAAKADGVRIIAVAISSSADRPSVSQMATQPQSAFFFTHTTYAEAAASVVSAWLPNICEEVQYVCRASSDIHCNGRVDAVVHGR